MWIKWEIKIVEIIDSLKWVKFIEKSVIKKIDWI
jgi:hypothetical protein